MMKNELVAMILAGGKGTRLGVLTHHIAKPAVPFGGKYRIIDFALSNCANSGVKHVGVVTQYQPLELNDHIGNGEAWGLDEGGRGTTILQPYSSSEGEKWFQGTANAVYQNLAYLDALNPEYVLILSGDHIYKQDYSKMLDAHIANEADLTIGVIPVPIEEASRFGIMNTDDTQRIIEFEEKPAEPKSNLASMGIYIFTWQKLRDYFVRDHHQDYQLEDFGHDVIPAYLKNNERVFAHPFHGYWKDVGTIQSLWEANMEYLNPEHPLNQSRSTWRIYTASNIDHAQYIAESAVVNNALITDGCYVAGKVSNAILSQKCSVGRDAVVRDSVLMEGVRVGQGATIEYAIIGEHATIEPGAQVIGTPDDIAVVGFDTHVGGAEDDQ